MANLAAQDSYLQGLARKVCLQGAPESRKRKFGNGAVTLRLLSLPAPSWESGLVTGLPPRGAWPRGVVVCRFLRKKKKKTQTISVETRGSRARCARCALSPRHRWSPLAFIHVVIGCGRSGILLKCASTWSV